MLLKIFTIPVALPAPNATSKHIAFKMLPRIVRIVRIDRFVQIVQKEEMIQIEETVHNKPIL